MLSLDGDGEEDQYEEVELLKAIGVCTNFLNRSQKMIFKAAAYSQDIFSRALRCKRYKFNPQFDIAHVAEKYPKLATKGYEWLRKRLGQAITDRRQYLCYIRDRHEKHAERLAALMGETPSHVASKPGASTTQPSAIQLQPASLGPSTNFTKPSALDPDGVESRLLTSDDDSDMESDASSYTSITRSADGDFDVSATAKIPKLSDLRTKMDGKVDCPFCGEVTKFKNQRRWRRHVFSDLRAYVCTLAECGARYFNDVNEWFNHEMEKHRVSYTCRLCPSNEDKTFQLKERYLAHLRIEHPSVFENEDLEKLSVKFGRTRLEEIPADDCPCCSDWVDRLKARSGAENMPSGTPGRIVKVDPAVFKRHLASHLEQLALFALPMGLNDEDDINSNAAVEDTSTRSGNQEFSTLIFESRAPSLVEGREAADEDSKNRETKLPPSLDHRAINTYGTEEQLYATVEGDLENDIQAARGLIEITPQDHPVLAYRLDSLVQLLRVRYDLSGAISDLEESIKLTRRTLDLTPQDSPDLAQRLNNLGRGLGNEFHWTKAMGDLEEGIQFARRAVDLTPQNHPDLTYRLENLAQLLGTRYTQKKEPEDLDETIESMRKVVDVTPQDDSNLAIRLDSLGQLLRVRYSQGKKSKDLEEAIQLGRQALYLTPQDHSSLGHRLEMLAQQLGDRFGSTGSMEDLEEAIQLARQAVNLTPQDHPDQAHRLDSLGLLLGSRYSQMKEISDLEEAIQLARRAVSATPQDPPGRDLARLLEILSLRLRDRFFLTESMEDLEEVIQLARLSVDATTFLEDVHRARRLDNLKSALACRSERTGEAEGADKPAGPTSSETQRSGAETGPS